MSSQASSSSPSSSSSSTTTTTNTTTNHDLAAAGALDLVRATDEKKAHELFDEFDKNGSGVINVKELAQTLKAQGQEWTEEEIKAMMQAVGGSSITFQQFSNIYALMLQLDVTRSGRLRKADLETALVKAGINATSEEVNRLFTLADKNGDGTIDFPEVWRLVASLPQKARVIVVGGGNPQQQIVTLTRHWYKSATNMASAKLNFQVEKPLSLTPSIDFAAGSLAGITGLLVFHPFDTIKVRLQTCAPLPRVSELYKGVLGPMLNVPLINAIVFASYGIAKRFFENRHSGDEPLSNFEVAAAGAFAGLANSFVVGPVELIKCRLQAAPNPPSIEPFSSSALTRRGLSASPPVAVGSASSVSSSLSSFVSRQRCSSKWNSNFSIYPGFRSKLSFSRFSSSTHSAFASFPHLLKSCHRSSGFPGPAFASRFSISGLVKRAITPRFSLSSVFPFVSSSSALSCASSKLSPGAAFASGSFSTSSRSSAGPLDLDRKLRAPFSSVALSPRIPTGPSGVIMQILREKGVAGLGKGMVPTIFREIPCNIGQFVVYEWVKNSLLAAAADRSGGTASARTRTYCTVMAGGLSGLVCWLVSYPQDVIKTRIQTQGISSAPVFPRHSWLPDGGMIACAKAIARQEGFRGFWRGFGPVALSSFPSNAAGFVAYETAAKYLSSWKRDDTTR